MRRREFIAFLGALAAWPASGRAQQTNPRIGLVSIGADPSNPVLFIPFLQQMRERTSAYWGGPSASSEYRLMRYLELMSGCRCFPE